MVEKYIHKTWSPSNRYSLTTYTNLNYLGKRIRLTSKLQNNQLNLKKEFFEYFLFSIQFFIIWLNFFFCTEYCIQVHCIYKGISILTIYEINRRMIFSFVKKNIFTCTAKSTHHPIPCAYRNRDCLLIVSNLEYCLFKLNN